jgi:hypothetical protein
MNAERGHPPDVLERSGRSVLDEFEDKVLARTYPGQMVVSSSHRSSNMLSASPIGARGVASV